ncbi:hypothetical protein RA28_09600 [Ruegeria sp. ANG-S4]|uniref:MATE family efflux transporter n=1 Tax=Ruegeria sp. ANG-S4 TaxID=1577904 RepID=UPI000582A629|nr:MATE family efflux transporter [Ruegeria sp. ANG-S4]KIC45907.1 hypothetical protein RA28_09600 [Ruegeria sp. ANG-S4]
MISAVRRLRLSTTYQGIVALVAAQFVFTAIGIIDFWAASKVDAVHASGQLLGWQLFWSLGTGTTAFVLVVLPWLSRGATRSNDDFAIWTGSATLIALALGLVCCAIFLVYPTALLKSGVESTLVAEAKTYLLGLSTAPVALLLTVILRSVLVANGKGGSVFWAAVTILLAKTASNGASSYFGWEQNNLILGLSTAISLWLGAAQMVFGLDRSIFPALGRLRFNSLAAPIKALLRLGFPASVTAFAETGYFAATTYLSVRMGESAALVHGVALNLVSLVFVVPFSIAQVASMEIQSSVGQAIRDVSKRFLKISACCSAVIAVCFFVWSGQLAHVFISNEGEETEELLRQAKLLIQFCGLFIIADAIPITTIGLLRGLRDTFYPMVISLACYWGAGFTAVLILGDSPAGIWQGMLIGVCCSGLCLNVRLRLLANKI